ncbi:MAG: hypothetical protein ACRDPC_04805 [Solirubrobacteraceae bacterium]
MTFAFADPATELYGLARLGLSGGEGSALALLFAGREPVAALARGGLPVDGGFEQLALPGLAATVDEPLRRWTVAFGDEDGFELAFEALAAPAVLEADEPAAQAGGMVGYEQLCRVAGTVRAGGRTREVRCAGQRGHSWGEPVWDRIAAARTVTAWLEDGTGVALSSIRPAGADDHAGEATWASLLAPAGSLRVDDPRLSTTYDADGRQRRAGLELWVGEEDAYPRRAAGVAICGAELDLGRLRLDCAFFRWWMDGRPGVGRYDILRRA